MIVTNVEPLGKLGYRLLDVLRRASDIHGPRNGIEAVISGNAVKSLDMVQLLYASFPCAIVATVLGGNCCVLLNDCISVSRHTFAIFGEQFTDTRHHIWLHSARIPEWRIRLLRYEGGEQ